MEKNRGHNILGEIRASPSRVSCPRRSLLKERPSRGRRDPWGSL